MKTFSEMLRDLRKSQGMTIKEVADKVGITHQYLAALENPKTGPKKSPSREVYKNLINVLCPNDPAATFELLMSAFDLYDTDDVQYVAPKGWIPQEAIQQSSDDIEEIWILSDKIGENVDRDLYEATVKNIIRGVRYRFFIPTGSLEWDYLLNRIETDSRIDEKVFKQQVICVACNPIMFFARIALTNPGQADAKGSIGVGVPEAPQFYNLDQKQIAYVFDHLSPVLRRFEDSQVDFVKYPTGEFRLLFPITEMQT